MRRKGFGQIRNGLRQRIADALPFRLFRGIRIIPDRIPEMDAVREKVLADVKAFEREEAFHKKIDNLCEYLKENGSEEKLAEKGFQVQKLENFTLEGSFSSLGNLLQIQSIFEFSKNLNAIELNQWSKAYTGQED